MRTATLAATLLGAALLAASVAPGAGQALRPGHPAPEIAGGGGPWINSAPLTLAALRGKVVAVEFWTYG